MNEFESIIEKFFKKHRIKNVIIKHIYLEQLWYMASYCKNSNNKKFTFENLPKILDFIHKNLTKKFKANTKNKSAKIRSKTFQGIADAMAEQWSNL